MTDPRQGLLFRTLPAARATDPVSSHEAAEEMDATGRRQRQAAAVLDLVQARPGSTSMELAHRSRMDRYQVARRLPELEQNGHVRRGDLRECLINGRRAVTWWPAEGA